ncbi:MAG: hypothetical protein QXQ05_12330 [Candidatus Jordarchaeales archaeon]
MRFLRVFCSGGGVGVSVDWSRVEGVFGGVAGRVAEVLVELVRRRCFEELGVFDVRVSDRGGVTTLWARVGGDLWGRVFREAEAVEGLLLERFRPDLRHVLGFFVSRRPLEPVVVARYSCLLGVEGAERYRVLSLACRRLEEELGVLAERMGYSSIGLVVIGGEEVPEELSLSVGGVSVRLRREMFGVVDWGEVWGRDVVKRAVGRAVKRALRGAGFHVEGLSAFEGRSVVEDERVSVYPGFSFSVEVLEDGHVALSINPRHRVVSRLTLWEEFGRSADRLRSASELFSGRRAVFRERTCVVGGVDEARLVSDRLEELGGVSLLEHCRRFDPGLVEGVDEGEPLVHVYVKGERLYCPPSLLRMIYTLEDLKAIGLSRRVQKAAQMSPDEQAKASLNYLSVVRRVDFGGQVVEFAPEMVELEGGWVEG